MRNQFLIRILLSFLISFLMFLIFDALDGLLAFIVFLILLEIIHLVMLLYKKKFILTLLMTFCYILLTLFYYIAIDSSFRINM